MNAPANRLGHTRDALLTEHTRLRKQARYLVARVRALEKSRDHWRQRARAAEWANHNRKEPHA